MDPQARLERAQRSFREAQMNLAAANNHYRVLQYRRAGVGELLAAGRAIKTAREFYDRARGELASAERMVEWYRTHATAPSYYRGRVWQRST